MLKFQPNVPVKETYNYLAKFSRFSLIEKIPPFFVNNFTEGSLAIANIIKEEIIRKNAKGQLCVLGLATGNSPLGIYKQLIKMHKNGQLSFKQVVTFNLDQYYPILQSDPQSYNFYMNEHLFKHIDIPKENTNIPNGQIQRGKIAQFCSDYQEKIASYGGIDIQILGIGRTGHIGFNEPPSPINSITRLVYLNKLTRLDAKSAFGGYENVPKCAISMGIQTIKKAKKIIIMAWSEGKAKIVKRTLQGEVNNNIPATFLHDHPNIQLFVDKAAGQLLTRFNTPWIIKGDIQDPIVPKSHYWVAKSVVWLSQKVKKPLLRLTYDDYEENNLSQLIMGVANGNVEDMNLYVYKKILNRISGWPLGAKPIDVEDIYMTSVPKKATRLERVLIFSPHPDDDVISMGGTLKKLHDQGHQVHVAYMTSGANGVLDIEARKYVYFLQSFTKKFAWNKFSSNSNNQLRQDIDKLIEQAKKSFEGQIDEQSKKTQFNLAIKQYIRNSEAKIALNSIGMKDIQAHSLQLPFYGTSHKKRLPIGQGDYQVIRNILRQLQPTAIYAAGDLTDPHGTHRKCLEVIMHVHHEQSQKLKTDPTYKSLFPPNENIFFYRGAWQQWQISMARKIIPMSPKDVQSKTMAILKHQSQKDGAKYMGEDSREFWVRAKQRNRQTAEKLNALGFSNYQACECFVNLNDLNNYDQI